MKIAKKNVTHTPRVTQCEQWGRGKCANFGVLAETLKWLAKIYTWSATVTPDNRIYKFLKAI